MNQDQANNLLAEFIQQTNEQHVDYWGYAGECLSLSKRWVDVIRNKQLDGPMGAPASLRWGSDYWVSPPDQINQLFEKQDYNPNVTYPRGSMFVNVRTNHIGILLDNQPGNNLAIVYEQDADPDHSPAHQTVRDKSRIDGVLVLRIEVITPTPVPVTEVKVVDFVPPAPPAAPVIAKPASKVRLVATVPVYKTEETARQHKDSAGTFPAGEYFLRTDKTIVKEIALTNMSSDTRWFVVADNLPPKPQPVPTSIPIKLSPATPLKPTQVPVGDQSDNTWKARYPINIDRTPVKFRLLKDVVALEYSGKRRPMHFSAGVEFVVTYYFIKDEVKFYTYRASNDEYDQWRFGIPLFDDNGNPNFLKIMPGDDPVYTLAYLFKLWRDDARHYLKGKKVWDIFK